MKHGIVVIFFMIVAASVSAQRDSTGVVVHKDPRIELLVKKQIEYNERTTRESRRFIKGYRIIVMSTNDQNKATDAKTKLYQEFPELKAHLQWQPPYFRLKVGDFKTRAEAEEYLDNVKRFFPTGVYVVSDTIEVNPDKSGELN